MSDVIIVGAGPAGSVLAGLLAQRSIEALLLDKAVFPRPKPCGDYLSPGTVRLLDRLHLLEAVQAGGARSLRGMRLAAPDGTTLTAGYPCPGGRGDAHPQALAISRAVLDELLLAQARRGGVKCLEGFQVTDVICEDGRVCGVVGIGPQGPETYPARMVVGADGRHSVVARRLGLHRPHPRHRRAALIAYYEGGVDLGDRGLISVGGRSYCILNPIGPTRTNAAIVLDHARIPGWKGRLDVLFDERLETFPRSAASLRGAERVGSVRCLAPLAYRARRRALPGALLVGDAAGFYDPFTGEGIFHALDSARRAAHVIEAILRSGRTAAPLLARFDRQESRTLAARERLGAALQAIIRRPALANAAARLLRRRPALAELLMGVVGELLPARALLSAPAMKSLLHPADCASAVEEMPPPG